MEHWILHVYVHYTNWKIDFFLKKYFTSTCYNLSDTEVYTECKSTFLHLRSCCAILPANVHCHIQMSWVIDGVNGLCQCINKNMQREIVYCTKIYVTCPQNGDMVGIWDNDQSVSEHYVSSYGMWLIACLANAFSVCPVSHLQHPLC